MGAIAILYHLDCSRPIGLSTSTLAAQPQQPRFPLTLVLQAGRRHKEACEAVDLSDLNEQLARAVTAYLERAAYNQSEHNDEDNYSNQEIDIVLEGILCNGEEVLDPKAGSTEIRLIQEFCTEDLSEDTWRKNIETYLAKSCLHVDQQKEIWETVDKGKGARQGLFEDASLNHAGFESADHERAHAMVKDLALLHRAVKQRDNGAIQELAQSFVETCIGTSDIGTVGFSTLLNAIAPQYFPALDSKSRKILNALVATGQFENHSAIGWDNKNRYFENVKLVTDLLKKYNISNTRVLYNARRDIMVDNLLEQRERAMPRLVEKNYPIVRRSGNVVFRGAPGTGKTYLARQIATYIVSEEQHCNYTELTPEQQSQIGFVQFHPSYDYSDFVEGLRPIAKGDGVVGFELRDGIFKQFVDRARANYENSQKGQEDEKQFVFIIDEINRGEISKILGELFFTIDPGYRGKAGEVTTQYANLHSNPEEKFYIPENVFIIGTMNDIDRSVDSFDFAMRRRFRFIEIPANSSSQMLEAIEDKALSKAAEQRMTALNTEIAASGALNENYQIGASYFLKLNDLANGDEENRQEKAFEALWTGYLEPLLRDYVQGLHDEGTLMQQFKTAFFNQDTTSESHESNQG